MKRYIDISNLDLVKKLSEHYNEIRNEYYRLAEFLQFKPNNFMTEKQQASNGKILYEGDFKLVFTRVVPESCSVPEYKSAFGDKDGNINPASLDRAHQKYKKRQELTPTLEQCLAPYIDHIGTVGFNLIYPGSKLNMHYGMCSDYIRIHMGIDCDPGAVFYVEDLPPRTWEPGKLFAFSDGDAFHGTIHSGETPRSILLLDLHKDAFKELKDEQWP
jgi:hypothetical protein